MSFLSQIQGGNFNLKQQETIVTSVTGEKRIESGNGSGDIVQYGAGFIINPQSDSSEEEWDGEGVEVGFFSNDAEDMQERAAWGCHKRQVSDGFVYKPDPNW
eukprot:TRINITY_DN3445_c0_g1_i2.p1 TRINITY_DN3445_c0_g1~~TRINITY_DN3445_c0_g1_i2.p1  ORF type:complete len:102 (-),score=28.89 TRINITY_DN3445_c0_g1_i2:54-359(-)